MKNNAAATLLFLFLALFAVPLYAEDEAELALDPPDEPLEEPLPTDADLREPDSGPPDESVVDSENVQEVGGEEESEQRSSDQEAFTGGSQPELLKYHTKIISERERIRATNEEEPPHSFHLGAGVLAPSSGPAGFSADFELYLSDHVTFGPVYHFLSTRSSSGGVNTTSQSHQILGAFNYYSRRPYEGIWVQLGAGVSFNSVTVGSATSKNQTIPMLGTLGWRWLGTNNLTFGLAVGAQGFFFERQTSVSALGVVQLGLAWNVFPH